MKKITFIINTWGDAHQLSRVINLEKKVDQIKILTYLRNYYPSSIEKEKIILGNVEHGKYIKRLFVYLRTLIYHIHHMRSGEVYYVFGFDNLFILKLSSWLKFKKIRIIYEIADLRSLFFKKNIISKIIRSIDKYMLKRVHLVVFTSQGYKNYYSNRMATVFNYFILENKVHAKNEHVIKKRALNRNIIIGYFGLLRCKRSLDILIHLCQTNEHVQVVLRGIFIGETMTYKEQINNITNLVYHGPYVSPNNLSEMYNEIDVSWIAYPYSDAENGNWQYAMTNRYYEAGYYGVPMISSKNTMDAQKVKEQNVGIAIDMSNIQESCREITSRLTSESVKNWKDNLAKIEKTKFKMSNEYDILKDLIYTS